MLSRGFFSFHIVDNSPWPLYTSCGCFMVMMSLVLEINSIKCFKYLWLLVLTFLILSLYGWMRDICYEGFLEGNHTKVVQEGLKMGMMLFIISEFFFFLSFFWSLFFFSISPSVEINSWPPTGLMSIDPKGVPLMGTLILISSGVSITWSHFLLLQGKKSCMVPLLITMLLGVFFSILQFKEYKECSFTISDSTFGSIFFLSTGFHGIHVIIGSLMLFFTFTRLMANHFSKNHHVGYEMSSWYWHFVDVIWLFLYACMYWWSY